MWANVLEDFKISTIISVKWKINVFYKINCGLLLINIHFIYIMRRLLYIIIHHSNWTYDQQETVYWFME